MALAVEATSQLATPSSHHESARDYFWNSLIDEAAAAAFLDLTTRTLQKWRQIGGGPKYIQISARCLRYRRADLKEWAEARTRKSTSDPGNGGGDAR